MVELLVVLTFLTLFAVIVIPNMAAGWTRSNLDTALEALRSDLNFSRARAVATGLRHQFELNASTGQIAVMPYHPDDAALGGQAGAALPEQPDVALQDNLPEGVRVLEWQVYPLGVPQAPIGGAGDLPLTFYPEGRSDSAEVVLEDERGAKRGFRLDGFNGELRELTAEEIQQ